jgi:hypothetical protein
MMRNILSALLAIVLLTPSKARSEPTREFIMSATYGVLAGTLVGAATLAFTDKPGDNLRNIARGASYGLYAGIFLGLYVAYGIPGEGETPPVYEQPGIDEGINPEDRSTNPEEPLGPAGQIDPPHFTQPAFMPLVSERGLEGGGVQIQYIF